MKGGDSMDEHELWAVFTQTGRAQDYLRYREAVMNNAPRQQEETHDGADGKGTDRSRISYR